MAGQSRNEEVELQSLPVGATETAASISYQLAHETGRQLEECGEFALASELLAVALAEEAQRINQQALSGLDLNRHPEEVRGVVVAMAQQQQHASQLRAPNLHQKARLQLLPPLVTNLCFSAMRLSPAAPEVVASRSPCCLGPPVPAPHTTVRHEAHACYRACPSRRPSFMSSPCAGSCRLKVYRKSGAISCRWSP